MCIAHIARTAKFEDSPFLIQSPVFDVLCVELRNEIIIMILTSRTKLEAHNQYLVIKKLTNEVMISINQYI